MLEVLLDIETTGLSTTQDHRIVEIGCVELKDQIPTNKIFHEYIKHQRKVSEEAYKVHVYSDDFLTDKKKFSEIVEKFLDFVEKGDSTFGPFGLGATILSFFVPVGIALGLSFELISRISGALTLTYNFSPLMSAVLPTLVVIVLAIVLLSRKSMD